MQVGLSAASPELPLKLYRCVHPCIHPGNQSPPPSPSAPHGQDGKGFGLLAPLIDRNTFRTSIRPPRPRRDAAGSLLLRVESGATSVKDNSFEGELG